MSRALNIDAPHDHVKASCDSKNAPISSIETLPGGCTRVVLCSADDAAIIKRLYGTKILTAPQVRTPLSLASRGVPLNEESRPSPIFVPVGLSGKRR